MERYKSAVGVAARGVAVVLHSGCETAKSRILAAKQMLFTVQSKRASRTTQEAQATQASLTETGTAVWPDERLYQMLHSHAEGQMEFEALWMYLNSHC